MESRFFSHILLAASLLSPLCLSAAPAKSASKSSAASAADLLEQGHEAYLDYDFDEARRLYAAAAKKAPKGDEEFRIKHNSYTSALRLATEFLDRVEQIEVIDSVNVARDKFFKAYRLPASAGSLGDGKDIPFRGVNADYVFTSENGDYKVWAQPDSTGFYRLQEAIRLTDGQWHDPVPVDDDLASDGDAVFPFMMPDGVTLYYADNGDNSMGGYDIMVATRDSSDGSFLQPQNMGMPYNSPYDDYLLAIDELNGIGWWATDRNQLDDEITIYIYKVNDLRRNYSSDRDDLLSLARISSISDTQDPDADYSDLLEAIRSIDPNAKQRKVEFYLPMDGGKVYTAYDDFRSKSAATMMRKYLEAKGRTDADAKKLDNLRRRYHESPTSRLGDEISKLELSVERQRTESARILSDVYRAERR